MLQDGEQGVEFFQMGAVGGFHFVDFGEPTTNPFKVTVVKQWYFKLSNFDR